VCEDIFERPVSELKRRNWLVLERSESVAAAARQMVALRIGSVVVTDGGKMVGIITERDLLNEMVERPFDPAATPLAGLMRTEVTTIRPDDPVALAIHRMSLGRHRRLPMVAEDGRAMGVLSVRDIVDYLADLFPHKIQTMPPDPHRIPEAREGG
jgi:CBS domain-containing protein